MATTETKMLDSIIASRRAVLLGAGALAATTALGGETKANAAVPSTLNDTQILNFALNLEYLEAQFYTLATEGVTADKSANKPISLGGSSAGAVTVKANAKVPFVNTAVQSYGLEIALEERNHVTLLQGALGSSAVAQPAINLQSSFASLGSLIGAANFDPFANDLAFLLGSYIFEDVGVTAYHGGALAISKTNLTTAAGIHAVEAYHAGIVRTLLTQIDQGLVMVGGGGQGQAAMLTNAISNVRATLDGTVGKQPTDAPGLTGQADFGINYNISAPLNGVGGPYQTSNIVDEGKLTGSTSAYTYSNYVAFGRTPQQVLNIVYASASGAKGGFFPNGLNGDIS